MNEQERRLYQRGNHFYTNARISSDGENWEKVDISNLSSSGLQMETDSLFKIGDAMWFHLNIQGFFSQFEIRAQGVIRRQQLREGYHIYGVSFIGLKQDLEILIDENVQNDRPVKRNPYLLD